MSASDKVPTPIGSTPIERRAWQLTAEILNSLLNRGVVEYVGLANSYDLGSNLTVKNLTVSSNLEVLGVISGDGSGITNLNASALAFGIVPNNRLDSTLKAFASLTISSNSLTLGTGIDSFVQVSFPHNTFPARASTGSLEPKTVTDFGLTLLACPDDVSARALLGTGTGSVTSVDVSGGGTGLTFTGGPVTTSGVITASGVLNVSSGGTGRSSLDAHRLLSGNGTGTLVSIGAGTDGQVLIGKSGDHPVFRTVSGNATVDVDGKLTVVSAEIAASQFVLFADGSPSKRAVFQFSGSHPLATRTYTFPTVNATLAGSNINQTFSGTNTFSATNTFSQLQVSTRNVDALAVGWTVQNSHAGTSARSGLALFHSSGTTVGVHGAGVLLNGANNASAPGGKSALVLWNYENAPVVLGTNNTLAVTVTENQETKFSGQSWFETATLTDAPTIQWNLRTAQMAVVTLGGNRTLANPTNMKNGGRYVLRVVQDGVGGRTLSFGSAYRWPGGIPPVLSTAAGAVDILSFVSDGTLMYGVFSLNFS